MIYIYNTMTNCSANIEKICYFCIGHNPIKSMLRLRAHDEISERRFLSAHNFVGDRGLLSMKGAGVLIFLFFAAFNVAKGQYNTNQNAVWVFGHYAGLDFSSGTPTPITTSINQPEGSASVSDASGSLLF